MSVQQKIKSILAAFAFIIMGVHGTAFSQASVRLFSPDKKIVFQFEIRNGKPGYNVLYENRKLIDFSVLKFVFRNDSFGNDVRLENSVTLDSVERYTLVTGRSTSVNDSFHQVRLILRELKQPKRSCIIKVRAFNSGVAYQFEFPKAGDDSLMLREEKDEFQITGNPVAHALIVDGFENAHEGNYLHRRFLDLPEDSLIDLPVLFSFSDSVYLAITEASLLDYAGMYLVKTKSGLISKLSLNAARPEYAVIAALPHVSPWRVLLVSHRAGQFLETNILTDLSPPNRISDLSWLKPGKTTFPWWNGNVTADTLNAPGNNFVTQQYYIDFCARNKIDYHSVVEYGLHQWYQDDGISFMPGPHSNVLTPVPGLDMKQVCDYAHSKGVGVRVWVHWRALYPKLDSAFALFEHWGLSGMMVDFMNRDDQEMVNIQTEILQKAAAHHLHIQFHGAYKPTGLNRTYPNEFTREATLNYEADKWNPKGVAPDHDLDIAFTRVIAGSTDYHLGGFRAVTADKFRAQYTRPLVLGTRSHMLAMYVVLENANAMVCDFPEAYEGQPGFDFIQQVPVTWDKTVVPAGIPDQFIIVARKKINNWWLGAVTGNSSRILKLNPVLSLGEKDNWKATIYQDDLKSPFNPNAILIRTITVDPSTELNIPLSAGGGFAMKLEKL